MYIYSNILNMVKNDHKNVISTMVCHAREVYRGLVNKPLISTLFLYFQ